MSSIVTIFASITSVTFIKTVKMYGHDVLSEALWRAERSGGVTVRSEILKAMNLLEAKTGRDTFSPKEIIRQVQSQTIDCHEPALRTHITSWMCVNTVTCHGGLYPDLFKVSHGLYRLNKK